MNRVLDDWIESYLSFVERTESARIYHKWVAMSLLASAVRMRVYLPVGRLKVFPNMYVVLVGEPGGPRKTSAIDYGEEFLIPLDEIRISADSITREALLEDLEGTVQDVFYEDKQETPSQYSAITIMSKEFESFLGQRGENTRMIVLLTDLFDAKTRPYKYRTKQSGDNTIPSPFLNLIAATTPESLASSMPSSAIGGGLTSRILFIWADKKEKKITFPEKTEADRIIQAKLQEDLFKIADLSGVFEWTAEARSKWDQWYQAFDEHSTTRLCKDSSFDAWYSRKPLYIQKCATIISVSRSSELLLTWQDLEKAIEWIEELEASMGRVFRAVGKSQVAADVDKIVSTIKQRGKISDTALRKLMWRDLDDSKFNNVILTAVKSGTVIRAYARGEGKMKHPYYPEGSTDTWYFSPHYGGE